MTNASYAAAEKAAREQTGQVQTAYDNAYRADAGDTTARDAYAGAMTEAAQARASADAVAAQKAAQIAELQALPNNPVTGDESSSSTSGGDGSTGEAYQQIKDMFPAPGKSADNPLIPNPIPNPIPVQPPTPQPEIVQAPPIIPLLAPPNPVPSLNPLPFVKKPPKLPWPFN